MNTSTSIKLSNTFRFPDWSSKTFLVAEDIHTNFLLIEAMLEVTHAKLLWARDGAEALEMFNNNSAIDITLMDINLPILTGLEVTREIRKKNPQAIIIAQTAYYYIHNKTEALNAGCAAFLTKPLRRKELIESINSFFS
ncbi:MAG: response regulator [Bacteroidales bacterium]|nr:response regulator [Bacteroidales bacterium]